MTLQLGFMGKESECLHISKAVCVEGGTEQALALSNNGLDFDYVFSYFVFCPRMIPY